MENLKKALSEAGIKFENSKVAKADLEKATEIATKNGYVLTVSEASNKEFGTKDAFMKALLKGTDFKVIDGTGIMKMKNNHVAKLSLITGGTSGQYTQLSLSIINKVDGSVDKKNFKFSENLIADPKNTHRNAKKQNSALYVWENKWSWYIDYPTEASVKSMFKTIEEYISHFDD